MKNLVPKALTLTLTLVGAVILADHGVTEPTPVSAAVAPQQTATLQSRLLSWSGVGATTDWCALTAFAAREAGVRQADADLWIQLGKCCNASGSLGLCIQEALDEQDDALDLVEDQYSERMSLCQVFGPDKFDPDIDPSEFSCNVTAALFPLVVGRTLVYEKTTPKGVERIEITTLNETRMIEGVECRTVRDIVYLDNVLVEDTLDWFAQKSDGSVWYFGEVVQNFEDGRLADLEGSWIAGENGAKPGVQMLAAPMVGDVYRQEFLLGEAEDIAEIHSLGNTVTVPVATYMNCVATEDFTPISPGNRERKFYAPGVGLVRELDLVNAEDLVLIQIINN